MVLRHNRSKFRDTRFTQKSCAESGPAANAMAERYVFNRPCTAPLLYSKESKDKTVGICVKKELIPLSQQIVHDFFKPDSYCFHKDVEMDESMTSWAFKGVSLILKHSLTKSLPPGKGFTKNWIFSCGQGR